MMLNSLHPQLVQLSKILENIKSVNGVSFVLDVENKDTEVGTAIKIIVKNEDTNVSFAYTGVFTPLQMAVDSDQHEDEFINGFFTFLIKEGILSLYNSHISNLN